MITSDETSKTWKIVGLTLLASSIVTVFIICLASLFRTPMLVTWMEGASSKVILLLVLVVMIGRLGLNVYTAFHIPKARRFVMTFACGISASCFAAASSPIIIAAIDAASLQYRSHSAKGDDGSSMDSRDIDAKLSGTQYNDSQMRCTTYAISGGIVVMAARAERTEAQKGESATFQE